MTDQMPPVAEPVSVAESGEGPGAGWRSSGGGSSSAGWGEPFVTGSSTSRTEKRTFTLKHEGSLPNLDLLENLPEEVQSRLKAALRAQSRRPGDNGVTFQTTVVSGNPDDVISELPPEAREMLHRFRGAPGVTFSLNSPRSAVAIALLSAVVGGAIALFLMG